MDQGRKAYDVFFSRLSRGVDRLYFKIDEAFFKLFAYEEEFDRPDLDLCLEVEKSCDVFVFRFDLKGALTLICDSSLEPFVHHLDTQWRLAVKFGEVFCDEDDGILILPFRECKINIAQYIYEMTLLALPKKRIHPEVEKGAMQSETLELLSRYSVERIDEKI